MAIIQALLAFVLKQASRVLNTIFGWATTLLFGKVPDDRQIYLSVTALGSLLWIVVALGVAFPKLGAFLLAFVPFTAGMNEERVRLGMLAAVILLPLGVGVACLFLVGPGKRPQGAAKVKAIFKGYPYTIGLALTLILVFLIAPFLKLIDIIRGWTDAHVPVVVEPRDYLDVVKNVQRILREAGMETSQHQASWTLRVPTKIFTFFARSHGASLVAEELTVLRASKFEVLLHPSDLVIRGEEADVARARLLITEHMAFSRAYLTWTRKANEIEDRLQVIWKQASEENTEFSLDSALEELAAAGRDIQNAKGSNEEKDILLRQQLLVERALLRRALGLEVTSLTEAAR